MLATVLITTAIAILAMLPGPIMLRGTAAQPGQRAAAATVSLVTMLLATALLGAAASAIGLGQLPAWVLAPVSLAGCAGAWLLRRTARPAPAPVEWQGLALAALMAAFGVFCLTLAIRHGANGSLAVHSWYNADWFKHLGHVHAIADYGVPARDIFGNGGPLYYYWLSYILPGAATAIGGDGWAALTAANTITTALFALTFYGVARMACPSRNLALAATFLGLFVTAPPGFFMQMVFGPGLQSMLEMPLAPKGPALLAIAQFIPQHTLAVVQVLAWALLCRPDSTAPRTARLLSLVSLAAIMTVSVLLGAMLLAAYGLTVLWRKRLKAAPELVAMAVLSGALVLIVGVLQFSDPNSSLASPLFANQPQPIPWYERSATTLATLFGLLGLPLLAVFYIALQWKTRDEPEQFVRQFSTFLLVSAFALAVLTEAATPPRIAIETLIRAVIPAGIGIALMAAWAFAAVQRKGGLAKRLTWIAVAAMVIVALPCAYIRTAWIARFGDLYTTEIPADDMRAMARLRVLSGPREVVWQYPEPPVLAEPSGGDAWAAVMAGRTVDNSQRATDFAAVKPTIDASTRFFAGEPEPIPAHVGWVYLSRVLHPQTYDALLRRMREDGAWRERACYPDACLFERRDAAK